MKEVYRKILKQLTIDNMLSVYASLVFVQFFIDTLPVIILGFPRTKVYVFYTLFFIATYLLLAIYKFTIFIKRLLFMK